MVFDFSQEGQVKVDMVDYISNMVEEFPMNLKPTDTAPTPASENLFAEGDGLKLDKDKAELFHTFVAKGLFACKQARPDIHTAIALLCTRVKSPNQDDWNKLVRLIKYCNGTRQDKLILSTEDLHVIKWYVDSAFGVHPDLKSHTGAVMTYRGGAAQSISRKHKLNTRSSTEAELVAADDTATMILWTKLFMEAQGHPIEKNILYQDNKSTILLGNNGKRRTSERTRAFNICYFFLTDQVKKGNLKIEYCPTTEMWGDFMSKPLQGKLFQKFKKLIMGH
ncbi:MAG: Ty1/Copia family ribonuclease HI [Thermoplasmata archaeon]